jgi:hypothetical protein
MQRNKLGYALELHVIILLLPNNTIMFCKQFSLLALDLMLRLHKSDEALQRTVELCKQSTRIQII